MVKKQRAKKANMESNCKSVLNFLILLLFFSFLQRINNVENDFAFLPLCFVTVLDGNTVKKL